MAKINPVAIFNFVKTITGLLAKKPNKKAVRETLGDLVDEYLEAAELLEAAAKAGTGCTLNERQTLAVSKGDDIMVKMAKRVAKLLG